METIRLSFQKLKWFLKNNAIILVDAAQAAPHIILLNHLRLMVVIHQNKRMSLLMFRFITPLHLQALGRLMMTCMNLMILWGLVHDGCNNVAFKRISWRLF